MHEGVKFTNRDHRTLPVKFASLLDAISIGVPLYLVADAAFACRAWRAGWWTRATILSRDYRAALLPMRQRKKLSNIVMTFDPWLASWLIETLRM
jgi:hypothetical protein